MYCSKILQRNCTTPVSLVLKAKYSRRNAKNTNSYKLVESDDALDDADGAKFGVNKNWELLTPSGFRFYMPGGVGPGWLDETTTARVDARNMIINSKGDSSKNRNEQKNEDCFKRSRHKNSQPALTYVAQKCPTLLRKDLLELFPDRGEVTESQLTIVTVGQKLNLCRRRWNTDAEMEASAKFFVLAASDICTRLKMVGFWADFINPFSGQPFLNPHKKTTLYKTDNRFRCLGFKIEQRNNCKIISAENNSREFVGSLCTTAPPSTAFLDEILSALNDR